VKKWLFLGLSAWLGTANATPVNELGDAGSLTGSAQTIGAGVSTITGSTGPNDTEDLYGFTWGGGLFEAATNGLFGSSRDFDTMLFLFDSAGTFIAANNDTFDGINFNLGSLISETLVAGDYFLGISGFSNDAENSLNSEFRFGATGVLDHWEGSGSTGNYTIGIAQNVPEPTSIALFGLGLAGLGLSRRKKSA